MNETLFIGARAWVPIIGEPFVQYQAIGTGKLAYDFFEWLDGRGFVGIRQSGPWTHWVFSQSYNDETIRSMWGAFIRDEPTYFADSAKQVPADIRDIAYRTVRDLPLPKFANICV